MTAPDLDSLARALEPILGRNVSIGALHRVSGGASRETWLFDATDGSGSVHRLVLRRDPSTESGATDRATEFQLLAAVDRSGVPVPRVVHLLTPDDGLGAGFVMNRVDGETIPRKILRDERYAAARPKLAAQCGTIAARIHAVDLSTVPTALPVQTPVDQLDQWQAVLDSFSEPHPAFELGLRWMRRSLPPPTESARLVHGDFRNGNFLVESDGIRAVLDWELSHLGDPIEDLGWLCVRSWRFGIHDKVVGGFGDVDALLDSYQAAGGTRPEIDALRFWIALGTLKWGVMCMMQAFAHISGLVRSVELAAIGRRVAETEHDLLRFLDGGW